MKLVTQCPFCYTRFIVKPKQLKAHQGQVKCGQCQYVFLANDYLYEQNPTDHFLHSAKTEAQQQKPIVLVLYALLGALALIQTLYFLRSDIVKQWPALRPHLNTVCQYLKCSVPLPKQIELIALDDTELVKDEAHADVIKFNCLIINNAPYAQSLPLLELTLTDKQDMPLMRRKITPKEYLIGSNAKLDDGIAANEEIHVALNLKTADLAVAGFRAFVLY